METLVRTRTCDTCGEDLLDGGPWPNQTCIEVHAVRMQPASGAVYSVLQDPVLDRAYHFCNMTCLAEWGPILRHSQRRG